MKPFSPTLALLALLASPTALMAKTGQNAVVATYSYADVADMVTRAPIVAELTINKASRLRGKLAAGVPAGIDRYLVTAQVTALLRGEDGLPGRIEYLLDLPANRPQQLKKRRVLVGAATVPGKPAAVRLATPTAQLDWTPELAVRTRTILTELVAPGAAPAVTGVGNAFHVRGTLPGESETQIFLLTPGDLPVSLSIIRRQGQSPRWAVALGEIVDDAAAAPARETLLWYRLACALPPALPPASLASLPVEDIDAVSADYGLVMADLGPCGRTGG